ncbi:PASTA domain-containing protein [Streptomyces sp. DH10]|uniref:PASTA domain-containing protein n=1 Tax=Streptomyces sp. DH10 TaxID=3040121 RepID=UPI00244182DC|nr:PASTA domain-containing protein [Streptomyces sp. DH10]MDG9707129.1 PASTA domain-containing protein [Streptomyces sp. DH10]
MRRLAVLVAFLFALGGCDSGRSLFEVKAVAAGVPSPAPFFAEDSGLGRDARVRSRAVPGGLQQGDTPGLYGGTKQPGICDVERLKRFLTAPRNGRKARVWAAALDLRADEIPGYLDRLTPVLLRHDTLALNHDYKKGKAVPFRALLQAGIAILVDEQGLPSVKCSCGNPLRPFEGDTSRISVTFGDGNEKWQGYDRAEVVVVRPAPRKLERITLVDVQDSGRGIERPVGTTGAADADFDATERRAVPPLAGTTFGEASRRLAEAGLAVAFRGGEPPPDRARVVASDPGAGTELRFGAYVTLSLAAESRTEGRTPTPSPSASSTPPSASRPPTSTGTPPRSTGPGPSRQPSSRAPSGSVPPPSSAAPRSSAPPTATGSPPRGTSSPPPATTSSPPSGEPVTSSAAPPMSSAPPPVSSTPASTAPATTPPATTAPVPTAPATTPPAPSATV